jgi:hypothetical protein
LLRELKSINYKSDFEDYSDFKATNLDPFIKKVIEEMSNYSAYFTSLSLNNLDKLCYYFIPSIYIFNNLTKLKITQCTVSAKDFSVLMMKLNKLECMELNDLTFAMAEHEEFAEGNIILPSSLKELTHGLGTILSTTLPSNPYKFLYDNTIFAATEFFYLSQYLPNLKNLKLTAFFSVTTNINKFLTLNPQLTHLSLPIDNIDTEIVKTLSKYNIKHLDLSLIHYFTIPPIQPGIYFLKSVTSLTIPFIKQIGYPALKKLFPLFPNLTKLAFKVRNYNVEYFTEIAANTDKLEHVIVDIDDYITEDIDLTMFHNVNQLKIQILDSSKILYKLPSPPANLKSVTICTDMQYLKSYNYMKEKYMDNSDWSIKLSHKTIHCTRLDSRE